MMRNKLQSAIQIQAPYLVKKDGRINSKMILYPYFRILVRLPYGVLNIDIRD